MPAQSVASPVAINPALAATRAAPVQARENHPGADQFGRDLVAARTRQEKPAAPAAPNKPAAGSSKEDTAPTSDAASKPADGAPSPGAKNPPASSGAGTAGVDLGVSTATATAAATATANATATAAAAASADAAATSAADAALRPGTSDATAAEPAPERTEHDKDGTDDKSSNANGVPQFALASLFPFVSAALPGAMAHRGAFSTSAGVQLGAHGASAVASSIADAAKMLLAPAANAQDGGDTTDGPVTSATGLASLLGAVPGHPADGPQAASTSAAAPGTAPLPPLPAPAAGTHLLVVATPVGSDGFNQDLAGQVTWLASQDVKQARIRVHPEDLGPVDLKVTMSHDHVDVVFTVQHPGTAQALQQSLPQLGQLLAQHGLSLGHAEVGQHGGNNPSPHQQAASATALDETTDQHVSSVGVVSSAPNLLDAFA